MGFFRCDIHGFCFNFLRFLYLYTYYKHKNEILYINDTINILSTNDHLLFDTFVLPSSVVYSAQYINTTSKDEIVKYLNTVSIYTLKAAAKDVFTIKTNIQEEINILKSSIPAIDIGIHIRKGDKITTNEADDLPIEIYIDAVQKAYIKLGKERVNIYLMTDTNSIIEEFRVKMDKNWSLYVIESVFPVDGHIQEVYNNYEYKVKAYLYKRLLAELDILINSSIVICTFTSNIGRYIYLKGENEVISVDQQISSENYMYGYNMGVLFI